MMLLLRRLMRQDAAFSRRRTVIANKALQYVVVAYSRRHAG